DISLARDLGLTAFRFSIAWPRVLPEGVGGVNARGLDHYEAVVDALLEAGITPFPYLYYWDLPVALQDRGGWANRDCADWFADYADVVFQRLGDRVPRWLTICEPWSIVHFGHILGEDAPGIRDVRTALRAGHHLLLGHGRAVQAYRASGSGGEIGISTVMTDVRAASDRPGDRLAAERVDSYVNRLFLEPVLRGAYPAMADRLYDVAPPAAEGDLAVIATPIDFLGVVYYLRMTVGRLESETEVEPATTPQVDGGLPADFSLTDLAAMERQEAVFAGLLDAQVLEPRGPVTDLGWEIAPDGLTDILCDIHDRYGNPPVYIAENGAAFGDTVGDNGGIDDPDRSGYLRDHLYTAQRAIESGVDLRGWSVWSLLDDPDNSFGLIHVDPETKRRTLKNSAHWYREVIAANGFPNPRA
ncbi:MAG: glycoside hydrolase family 1 protein, partial [Stackebrandtia sp.]